MADGNEFKVIISGDGKELNKTLDELEKDLKDFQKQLGSTKDIGALADLNKKLQETKSAMEQIRRISPGNTLAAIKPGAVQASASLNDMSRIVQDLPFGFMGVSNNLNPMVESFGRLKAELGSGRAAIGAMASSLIGSGGLGIAIAAVSTGILLFQKYQQKTAEETKKANDEIKAITSSIAQEASRVSVLVSAFQTETLTRKQRYNAIEELKRINPTYFGQLRDEANLVNTLTSAYGNYLANLKNQFFAKSIDKKLADLFDKRLQLETSIEANKFTINDPAVLKQMADIEKKLKNLGADAIDFSTLDLTKITPKLQEILNLKQKLANIENRRVFDLSGVPKQIAEIDKQVNALLSKRKGLGNFGIAETKDVPVFVDESMEKAHKILNRLINQMNKEWDEEGKKMADSFYDSWGKQLANQAKVQGVVDQFARTNDAIKKGIVGIQAGGPTSDFLSGMSLDAFNQERINGIIKLFESVGKKPPDLSWTNDLSQKALLLHTQWQELSKGFLVTGEMLTNFLSPAFSQFFEGILSGTQSAGDLLRSFFVGLIKQITVTIAQAAALAAVMSAFGFSVGGASGFGNLFKGFLGGGANFGGLGSFGGNFNVTGVLRGQDIFLSGQRGGAALGRIGGGLAF